MLYQSIQAREKEKRLNCNDVTYRPFDWEVTHFTNKVPFIKITSFL